MSSPSFFFLPLKRGGGDKVIKKRARPPFKVFRARGHFVSTFFVITVTVLSKIHTHRMSATIESIIPYMHKYVSQTLALASLSAIKHIMAIAVVNARYFIAVRNVLYITAWCLLLLKMSSRGDCIKVIMIETAAIANPTRDPATEATTV